MRLLLLYDQAVLILRRLPIAKGHACTDKLPFLFLHCKRCLYLHGKILAVEIVQKILEGNVYPFHPPCTAAVIIIIYGNEAYPHKRKDLVQTGSKLDVISRKPREVLDHDAVDGQLSDCLKKGRNTWSLEIGSGITFVYVNGVFDTIRFCLILFDFAP